MALQVIDSVTQLQRDLTVAEQGEIRTGLGLGTAATTAATAYATAAQGAKADTALQSVSSATISDASAAGRAVLTAADASAQRTSLGAMANTLPAVQSAFDAGTAAEKASFQAAVSGYLAGPFGADLRPVTNRLVWPEQNTAVLPGSVTTLTYRSRHTIQENTPFVIIVWANGATPAGASGNAVTYKASYDYAPAGTSSLNSISVVPITLQGGQTTVTVPFGGFVRSDPIFGPFKKGDILLVRTNVTVSDTAKKVPFGMTLNWGFEGTAAGDATATANYLISFSSAGPGVSPVAILGPTSLRRPAIAIAGDSINDGAGDSGSGPYSNLGCVTRALEGVYGSLKVCQPGEQLATAISSISGVSNFSGRGMLLQQCTHVVCNFGTNDISNGATLAALQANILQFASMYCRGRPYYAQTLDPRTTSTDSWATVANQSLMSGESVRTGYNSWLRDGAPIDANGAAVAVGTVGAVRAGAAGHPIAGVFDTAARVEVNSANTLTLNGGYWITNGTANYPTADGIHNSAATSILKSAAIDISRFV